MPLSWSACLPFLCRPECPAPAPLSGEAPSSALYTLRLFSPFLHSSTLTHSPLTASVLRTRPRALVTLIHSHHSPTTHPHTQPHTPIHHLSIAQTIQPQPFTHSFTHPASPLTLSIFIPIPAHPPIHPPSRTLHLSPLCPSPTRDPCSASPACSLGKHSGIHRSFAPPSPITPKPLPARKGSAAASRGAA